MPADKHHDLDYLVELLDWEANVNPNFGASNHVLPEAGASRSPRRSRTAIASSGSATARGYYSAKELTVLPGRRSRSPTAPRTADPHPGLRHVRLAAACRRPSMIRFGQMTEDEVFVTAAAAQAGVRIENLSATDPLVMLKHFGPGNPDAEPLRNRASATEVGARARSCVSELEPSR